MGRSPCCSKVGLNRGAWTALEDHILTCYIKANGEGKWRDLPKRAGLKRCGKSCRLRWLNYLRPDIKRGNISNDEEELIIRLHKLLGNRWSLIAGRLPGRTDNEIKNYWNTTLAKKTKSQSPSSPPSKQSPIKKSRGKNQKNEPKKTIKASDSASSATDTRTQAIRAKASRCSKVVVPALVSLPDGNDTVNSATIDPSKLHQGHQYQSDHFLNNQPQDSIDSGLVQCSPEEQFEGANSQDSNMLNYGYEFHELGLTCAADAERWENNHSFLGFEEPKLNDFSANCLEDNHKLCLDSLAFFLDCDEWPLHI
ncbi:hypothetical protein FNV43_RR11282 [Rhamnella rubrinervis]|uniref:Myb-related protein 123 n=1 Tax=Rhamnella rubrinervis TaxID=2594499 RepID=A0A8K0H5P6_9ROSA|nr:hypothetical protein FNV43_RR11282 [Rhamnella rubrinervis]